MDAYPPSISDVSRHKRRCRVQNADLVMAAAEARNAKRNTQRGEGRLKGGSGSISRSTIVPQATKLQKEVFLPCSLRNRAT